MLTPEPQRPRRSDAQLLIIRPPSPPLMRGDVLHGRFCQELLFLRGQLCDLALQLLNFDVPGQFLVRQPDPIGGLGTTGRALNAMIFSGGSCRARGRRPTAGVGGRIFRSVVKVRRSHNHGCTGDFQ